MNIKYNFIKYGITSICEYNLDWKLCLTFPLSIYLYIVHAIYRERFWFGSCGKLLNISFGIIIITISIDREFDMHEHIVVHTEKVIFKRRAKLLYRYSFKVNEKVSVS